MAHTCHVHTSTNQLLASSYTMLLKAAWELAQSQPSSKCSFQQSTLQQPARAPPQPEHGHHARRAARERRRGRALLRRGYA